MKSIKEFADELGVNERTVRRHISKLNIIPQKQGSKQLLNADAQELIKKAVVDSGHNARKLMEISGQWTDFTMKNRQS